MKLPKRIQAILDVYPDFNYIYTSSSVYRGASIFYSTTNERTHKQSIYFMNNNIYYGNVTEQISIDTATKIILKWIEQQLQK